MKKILYLTLLWASFAVFGVAQSINPTVWTEADGSPRVSAPSRMTVTNGSLVCVGKRCTLSTGAGGAGTVTSVSVVTANGVSGSVATATTTPAITLTLGAITPTSVTASLAGTPYTGTNTTDAASVQTMLLRGNRATPTSNDEIYASFSLANAAGTQKEIGRITAAIFPNTAGAEGGRLDFSVAGSGTLAKVIQLSPGDISPSNDNTTSLGTNGTLQWSDLYFGTGAVIGWATSAVTLTHSANTLTFAGASTGYAFDSTIAATNLTANGAFTQTSGVTTGTGATSGTVHTYNSLTTGVGANFSSSSVTSGSIVNIASTSTAGATGVEGLNIAMSGANGTNAQTITGATISVTNTNATSGTNIALVASASGATTNNVAIHASNGAVVVPTSVGGVTNSFPGSSAITYELRNNALNFAANAVLSWAPASGYNAYGDISNVKDVAIVRTSIGGLRITNGSTGAGNLSLGTSATAFGTSGVGVLAFTLSTAPSTSPVDTVQVYSGDSAAGAHNLFTRNELGEVNRLTGLSAINAAAFAKTSDTTLANITGLSRNVEAGRTYAFRAVLESTAAATGGVKFAVSGTATATSINYEGKLEGGAALIAQTRATALDTTVCASTTTTAGTCTIEGVIVVNAAGTLTIQFAQNNSDGGASTVLINQYMQLIPIS